jgi:hypothetical protein
MRKMLKKISIAVLALGFLLAAYQASANFFGYSWFWRKPLPPPPKIDLKVDSECHYWQNGVDAGCFDATGQPFGDWEERDLTVEKFFNFADLKPGDRGEDTISLHVLNDDGCGDIVIRNVKQSGNLCNEPETESGDCDCRGKKPGVKERQGELWKQMRFSLWLDQGSTPGFQGKSDPGEGNNIFDENDYMIEKNKRFIRFPGNISIRNNLRKVRFLNKDICNAADPDGDGKTNYGPCHGLARDGRMVESATYYYGFSWELPESVGNAVQTDSLKFDLGFRVKSNSACSPCFNSCNTCEWHCND